MTKNFNFDVAIIGAGAAGMMCAIEAGKRGRRVLIVEKSKAAGEKIRISGGGRCNFTNLNINKDNFLSNNQHFCISALKRYTQGDFIALVEKHGIAYHEKTLGQLFCDISSKQIINMLLKECEEYGVEIKYNTEVTKVAKIEQGYELQTDDGQLQAESLVIATGGLSIPKMGATDFGYKIAQQFDIEVVRTMPALVPLTFYDSQLQFTKALAGVSALAEVKIGKRKFKENILFTHRGISGPAILQISSYWQYGGDIEINLLPDHNLEQLLKNARDQDPKNDVAAILSQYLAKRLVDYILQNVEISGRVGDLSNKKIALLAQSVNSWQIDPAGSEGYAKAEVTIGGVSCDDISSKTFESKKVPGLFFIGEVLDVTGHLGGYNFQWAWSSGFVCGNYA